MKHYFVTLIRAILGLNPFREELEKSKDDYEKIAARVSDLEQTIFQLNLKLDDAKRNLSSLQVVAENLRANVMEKAAMLEEERKQAASQLSAMIAGHEEDTAEYEEKIANLRSDLDETLERLQEANKALGKECMCQNLLDKTNNGLTDLYSAMTSESPERIKEVVEYLDWSNPLSKIAQSYLKVLTRKNELQERLHLQ